MAFFKFRKSGDDQAAAAAQVESVEVIRRRARHRLIGAVILVLIGVIGFPLLFDATPRPISVDVPIDIPDKSKVKPLAIPAPLPAAAEPAASGSAPAVPAPAASGKVSTAGSLAPKEEVVSSKPAAAPAPKAEATPEPKPEPNPGPKASAKPAAKADDGAKALALLEGKAPPATAPAAAPPAAAEAGRFVVQVGAFADAARAREARLKLEKAGLKTYTQVVDTKDGKRTRVRVGPFPGKADADKAADKIKKLDLPAAILEL